MDHFHTQNLEISYENRIIVEDLNIAIPKGKITALVGANGSGKSTILKTMSRLIKPSNGAVLLDGKKIHKEPSKQIAKMLAILPQNPVAPDNLTVHELITYGRTPHKQRFRLSAAEDKEKIDWAIKMTNLEEFVDRPIVNLSGGQRQRAWIAMVLAQDTPILFLDEPTTFLDMTHQLDVMNILKQLNELDKRTIVMVVHDLNHASRYADYMIAIKSGKVAATGSPQEVITEMVLEEVFNIKADILIDPRTNTPLCFPYETCSGCEIKSMSRKSKHSTTSII